ESGLGQRPTRPGEALLVPARELSQSDAVAGRVDEPAVAEVNPRVVDLCGLRPRAGRAPEENVSGLEPRKRHSLRGRYLAAHRERGSTLERVCQCGLARIGLKLVDAPDE